MNGQDKKKFQVTLTADFFDADGSAKYRDLGLSVLDDYSHIHHHTFAEHRPQIGPDQIGDAQGVIVLTPAVTAQSVSQADNLLAIGRFGVGYDAVDVEACTQADVAVFITAGAVDRSVAEATVGWMIAISHQILAKDQLVRNGKWDKRSNFMGSELRDRVVGVIGLGGIARAVLELLRGFGMKTPLGFDPFIDTAEAQRLGVKLVDLGELLREADYVSIHCPLNDHTRGLIGAAELAMMKREAYLINTARGGIVNEDALYAVLKCGRIAGAAIDCFAEEPVTAGHQFSDLDNVILAPHSIAWTNELFRDIGRMVCQGMVDISLGQIPKGVVNSDVFDRPGFQAKWQKFRTDRAIGEKTP